MTQQATIQGRQFTVEPSADARFVAVLVGARGARYGAWPAPELASGKFYVTSLKSGRSLCDGFRPVVVEL